MQPRHRGDQGIALPSPVAVVSLAAVLVAGAAFALTGGTPPPSEAARTVTAAPTQQPSPTAPRSTAPAPVVTKATPKPKPAVTRADVLVEVYNNSGISGLAGSTAGRIDAEGWQVVGSDNWYGTIPASTVYFPERLRAEAKLLAKDLGITRLKPAIAPMRFDRLTVILTADFA